MRLAEKKRKILYLSIFGILILLAGTLYFTEKKWSLFFHSEALLQGSIAIKTSAPSNDSNKIMPGMPIYLSTKIKNQGNLPSQEGVVFIRFAFPHPLEKQANSLLFRTEDVVLPSLAPDQEIEISFKSPHQWPTLYDFIRFDWGMRRYQTVVKFGDLEYVIAQIPISFSAYYYPGLMEQYSEKVPAIKEKTN